MKCGRFQRFCTYREGYCSFYMFIVTENFQSLGQCIVLNVLITFKHWNVLQKSNILKLIYELCHFYLNGLV